MIKALRFMGLCMGLCALATRCTPPNQRIDAHPRYAIKSDKDTLSFDSLLVGMRSITKGFLLRNPNAGGIHIDEVALEGGSTSPFRITVQGQVAPQQRFFDLFLAGQDVLPIYVDVMVPKGGRNPSLRPVTDSVITRLNGHRTVVVLSVKAQDAHYDEEARIVMGNETWDTPLPYVIKKGVEVQKGATLSLSPGVRLFFDNGAFFRIQGRLIAKGTPESPILMNHVRWDKEYARAGGQWKGLLFSDNSKGHDMAYLHIKNAEYGLKLSDKDATEGVQMTLNAMRIRHCSQAGIAAFKSTIEGSNLLIYNCKQALLQHALGGNYTYAHCTFSNYPQDFTSFTPAFQFSDTHTNSATHVLEVYLRNSIFWGASSEEFSFTLKAPHQFILEAHNSIFRSQDKARFGGQGNHLSLADNYVGFVDPQERDYRLKATSVARNQGTDIGIGEDITGRARDSAPDIGAYEFAE